MCVSAISITGWDGCKTCYDPFSTNEINDCPSASIINEQAMAYEKIHKKN